MGQTKRMIVEAMLVHDYDFAVKCLLLLYEKQTLDEQQVEQSIHENNVGFNAPDSSVLSSYAEWIREGKSIQGKEREDLHQRMRKYAKQLTSLVSDKDLEL